MADEFHRDYLIRLPLPLAQLYRRAHNEKSPRGRHDHCFYLLEAMIKLAAAPAVACYLREAQQGQPRVEAIDRLLCQLALPSLGQWVGFLRELSKYFGTRTDAATHPLGDLDNQLRRDHRDLPAVLALYRRIKNGPDGTPGGDRSCSLLQLIEALVPYRNTVFGHGAPRMAGFYEQDIGPLLFPAINEILAEGVLEPFGPAGSRLLYLAEVRTLDDRRVELSFEELVGERSERIASVQVNSDQAAELAPNRVGILWPGHRVPLLLDPLVVYRKTEFTEDVLFLNRDRNGRQVEYLSYMTGRTERDATTAAAMVALLAAVTGRSVNAERLAELQQQSVSDAPSFEQLLDEPPVRARQFGDFELLAELGRGGMGVVYLARQLSLGRLVALKMLPAHLAADEVALARFRREIRALGRCDHPNIVKVLSTGTSPDGQLYYAMEYVPGADLELIWREVSGSHRQGDASDLGGTTWARAVLTASQKLRQKATPPTTGATDAGAIDTTREARFEWTGGSAEPTAPDVARAMEDLPLPPLPQVPAVEDDPGGYARRVAMLVRDAALAVQAVHDQDIVHRDVKPANLMLTPDGTRVVLMDFGLAKGQSFSLTASRSGGFLGTLRYAAPEQLAAAKLKVGPQADVRALGVTLWELLTRRRLFGHAEDEHELASCVLTRDVPRLRSVDRTLAPDLEAIVLRATERDASQRIQTARELAEYLNLYLLGKPIPVRPPGIGELAVRWVRGHKVLISSVATAATAILLTIVIALVQVTLSLERETSARRLTERQLRRATALRLAAESAAERRNYPQRSTLLAIEAVEVTRRAGEPWVPEAYEALRASLADCLGVPLKGHRGRVTAMAVSPDGRWLASGSEDCAVRVWQLDDTVRTDPRVLTGHEERVTCLTFSPDGHLLVSGSADATGRVWDLRTANRNGAERILRGHGGQISDVRVTVDGRRAVTASFDNTARLWDLASTSNAIEPIVLSGHENWVMAIDVDRSGRWLATGGFDGRICLWDLANENPSRAVQRLPPLDSAASAVVFHPSGRGLATANEDGTVRLWDIRERGAAEPSVLLGSHGDRVNCLAFSRDGRWLAAASSDSTARLWDLQTEPKEPLSLVLRGHEAPIQSVVFAPDSHTLVTAGDDRTVRVWAADLQGSPACRFVWRDHEAPVPYVAITPEGGRVVTGSYDGTIRLGPYRLVQDQQSSSAIAISDSPVEDVALLPGERLVAVAAQNGCVQLWDWSAPQSLLLAGMWKAHREPVTGIWASPQSRWLITHGRGASARLWELPGRSRAAEPRLAAEYPGSWNTVAVSPDQRWIASASDDGEVGLGRIESGRFVNVSTDLAAGEGDTVAAFAFDLAGRWLAAGTMRGTVEVWDLTGASDAAWKPAAMVSRDNPVGAIAFDASGQRLAVGTDDGRICLWNLSQGPSPPKIRQIGQNKRPIRSIAFSPNSRYVAAVCRNSPEAAVYDLQGGGAETVPVLLQSGESAISVTGFSPNEGWFALGCDDGRVSLWNLTSGELAVSGSTLKGHRLRVNALGFGPDADWLLTGSADATIRMWDLRPESIIERARILAGRSLTPQERQRYLTLRDAAAE